jgi:hypothetical protein
MSPWSLPFEYFDILLLLFPCTGSCSINMQCNCRVLAISKVIEGFLRSNFSAPNKPSIKLSPRWATDGCVDWVKPVAFRNKTLLTFDHFPKTFNHPKP